MAAKQRKRSIPASGGAKAVAKAAKKQQPQADDGRSDWSSMLLLLLLYTLQGIPMGLSSSIPFILQEKVRCFVLRDWRPR